MAIYIAIDEGYSPTRLNSIKELFSFVSRYYTKDGTRFTFVEVQKEMRNKYGTIKVYGYDREELEDVLAGERSSKDWEYIIHKV
ncbi:conserved hypothetical protein [Vibrio chagasii]|nr:conserved hypothetical protein [Vibrio chagasii]